MRLDRIITLRFARRIQRKVESVHPQMNGNDGTPRALPILMYHSISNSLETGVRPYYRTSTSPERFAEQIHFLHSAGWQGIDLRQGLNELARQLPSSENRRAFVITFDDGFRDFAISAERVLATCGFKATIYLSTAYCSPTDTPRQFLGRDCLTWNDVRRMRKAGISLGSHTITHPKLVTENWDRVRTEVIESKAAIEDALQEPIEDFAYPFSYPVAHLAFRNRFKELLRASGYTTCVTTNIGTALPSSDLLELPRLPMNNDDDSPLLGAKMAGAYDWLSIPQILTKYAKRPFLWR